MTLKTIYTIRCKIPDAAIILIDLTSLPSLWKQTLIQLTEKFVDTSDDPTVLNATDTCLNKGSAECLQLLEGVKYIEPYINATHIFKITGRYFLNDTFVYSTFLTTQFCFMLIPSTSTFFEPTPACYTSFYSIPIILVNEFKKMLFNTVNKGISTMKSIETILPFECDSSLVTLIPHLGITGVVGPFGTMMYD